MKKGKLFIGTSGYNYSDWKERFYPKGLPQSKWLEHYQKFFNTVELNVTFYRLPNKSVFRHVEVVYMCSSRVFCLETIDVGREYVEILFAALGIIPDKRWAKADQFWTKVA